MLGARHGHAARVRALLEAARTAVGDGFAPLTGPLGLEVEVRTPNDSDPWDATNYLGGIGDVLEVKSRRGALAHLGDLAAVALYENDRQIKEVGYRATRAAAASYAVRLWSLSADRSVLATTPVAPATSFHAELASQMDAVFAEHRGLVDQRKRWPWLTGALGDPYAGIFFVGENPSETAVEDIDAASGVSKDPNLQWASTRGDRLFREALGRQRFCDGDPLRPATWHAYLTDVMKSTVRVAEYARSSPEAKADAARLWAPVLRWELTTGKPLLVVAVGGRAKELMTLLQTEKRIPSNYEFMGMTHYAYVGQRAQGSLGPMHPQRVKAFHVEMAKIAAEFRRLRRGHS